MLEAMQKECQSPAPCLDGHVHPGATLRPARSEDVDFAEALTADNMREFYRRRGSSWDSERYKATFGDFDNHILWVDGARVGVLRLQCMPDGLWVRGLEVAESHWNQGLGTACVNAAVRWAFRPPGSAVRVKVFAENRAIALYTSLGFVQERTDGNLTWFFKDILSTTPP